MRLNEDSWILTLFRLGSSSNGDSFIGSGKRTRRFPSEWIRRLNSVSWILLWSASGGTLKLLHLRKWSQLFCIISCCSSKLCFLSVSLFRALCHRSFLELGLLLFWASSLPWTLTLCKPSCSDITRNVDFCRPSRPCRFTLGDSNLSSFENIDDLKRKRIDKFKVLGFLKIFCLSPRDTFGTLGTR